MTVNNSVIRQPLLAAVTVLLLFWTLSYVRLSSGTSSYTSIASLGRPPVHTPNSGPALTGDLEIPIPATEQENSPSRSDPVAAATLATNDRPLVLYAYSESDEARRNLEFFLAHGIHGAADFVFIFNGDSNMIKNIPHESNIVIVKRPNDCYDLGAYAEVLTAENLYQRYKRFIFLNASIRGPFLPTWAKGCWTEMYLQKLSEKVKLVGMTGNCWPKFHVQSMIWATDIVGLKELLFPREQPPSTTTLAWPPESTELPPAPGINHCFHDWTSAVFAEVGASQIIRNAGYEIDVMMTAYHGAKDDNYESRCDPEVNGDVLWQGKYEGTNVHPYETIFMKTNRDIDPVLMERLTEWHDNKKLSSYDYCV